eukprot:365949-Chlamydomonas_euryale.AAC.21
MEAGGAQAQANEGAWLQGGGAHTVEGTKLHEAWGKSERRCMVARRHLKGHDCNGGVGHRERKHMFEDINPLLLPRMHKLVLTHCCHTCANLFTCMRALPPHARQFVHTHARSSRSPSSSGRMPCPTKSRASTHVLAGKENNTLPRNSQQSSQERQPRQLRNGAMREGAMREGAMHEEWSHARGSHA